MRFKWGGFKGGPSSSDTPYHSAIRLPAQGVHDQADEGQERLPTPVTLPRRAQVSSPLVARPTWSTAHAPSRPAEDLDRLELTEAEERCRHMLQNEEATKLLRGRWRDDLLLADALQLAKKLRSPVAWATKEGQLKKDDRRQWFYYKRQQYMRELIEQGRAAEIPGAYLRATPLSTRRLFELTSEEWWEHWGISSIDLANRGRKLQWVERLEAEPRKPRNERKRLYFAGVFRAVTGYYHPMSPKAVHERLVANTFTPRRTFSTTSAPRSPSSRTGSAPELPTPGTPGPDQHSQKQEIRVTRREKEEMDQNLESHLLSDASILVADEQIDSTDHLPGAGPNTARDGFHVRRSTGKAGPERLIGYATRPSRISEKMTLYEWRQLYFRLALSNGMNAPGIANLKRPERAAEEYERNISHRQFREGIWDFFDLSSTDSATWDSEGIRKKWADMILPDRQRFWPLIMLETLNHAPQRAVEFLEVTHQHPHPPGAAIADAFGYLVALLPLNGSVGVLQLLELFHLLVDRGEAPSPGFSHSTINILMHDCSDAEVERFYTAMRLHGFELIPHVAMELVVRFAAAGHRDLAYEVFREYSGRKPIQAARLLEAIEAISPAKNRRYATISLLETPAEQNPPIEIKLDTATCTMLLQHHLAKGDTAAAYEIFSTMETKYGALPNAVTFLVMLHDAKKRADFGRIEDIVAAIKQRGLLRGHNRLATEYLSTVRNRPQFEKRPQEWAEFISEYEDLFEPGLAGKVGLCPSDRTRKRGGALVPTRITNELMITSFIRAHSTVPSFDLGNLYQRFLDLIQAGDEEALDSASERAIWHGFLMGFGQLKDQLRSIQLVHEMEQTRILPDGSSFHGPAPNVATWTILLRTVHDPKDPTTSWKVLSIMQQRGVVLDRRSWNALVQRAANSGATGELTTILHLMRKAGFEIDIQHRRQIMKLRDGRQVHDQLDALEKESLLADSEGGRASS